MNRARANAYLLGLLILCQQGVASDEQTEQPAMELLEFLGSAEMIDGEWLDPLYMVNIEKGELDGKQQEERGDE